MEPEPEVPPAHSLEEVWADYFLTLYLAWGYDISLMDFADYMCDVHGLRSHSDFDYDRFKLAMEYTRAWEAARSLGPIPNDAWAWSSVRQTICPMRPWLIDRTLLTVKRGEMPCNSKRCPECAPANAAKELARAAMFFGREGAVYFAEVPLSDYSATRLRARLNRWSRGSAVGYAVFHRQGPTGPVVHIYASAPLMGRKPPVAFVRLTPAEALQRVHEKTLALPRIGRQDYAGSWRVPPTRKPVPKNFRFPGVESAILDQAIRETEQELKNTDGVDNPLELTMARRKTTYADRITAKLGPTAPTTTATGDTTD